MLLGWESLTMKDALINDCNSQVSAGPANTLHETESYDGNIDWEILWMNELFLNSSS